MTNTTTQYETVIGLEIHVQLATKTKMFCRCDNDSENAAPNTNVCPVCMGYPGTLPVANEQAILWGNKTALALGCELNLVQRFDRKNYFYPDLPKGYQISQFFYPAGEHGEMMVDYLGADRKTRQEFKVGITRLHLEEDAGKLTHDGAYSYADYNRCGTPLMEIVTEPDLREPAQARAFIQELQRIVRALGVSRADMEKGHLRVDGNISVRPVGQKEFGNKVEVKNINSAKFLEQALKFEVDRQITVLERGEVVVQETRGWDEKTGTTISQRIKEGSIDYRYFPEPDLPPIELSEETVGSLREALTHLPAHYRDEAEKLGLTYTRIVQLQDEGKLEAVVDMANRLEADASLVANWIEKLPELGEGAGDFLRTLKDRALPNTTAQKLHEAMIAGQTAEEALVALPQVDSDAVQTLVEGVLKKNAEVVERFKAGETKLMGFLVGQVMAEAKGSTEPALVQQILTKLLTD